LSASIQRGRNSNRRKKSANEEKRKLLDVQKKRKRFGD
jgi:hypothetical protein